MSTVPNTFASTSIFKGDITTQDFLHLVRESDGSILGWLDENGIPQGSMAIGGGGGGSSVFVNGTPVNNPDFLAGPGVAYTILGSNVTLSNTGVLSLNSLTGALSAVLSLNSLVGNLNITAGAGIGVTPSGASVQVTNAGVTSFNSLVGDVNVAAGSGIVFTPSGNGFQISSSGIANVPWLDIQNYGGVPKSSSAIANESTTCTLNGTTTVRLGAAKNFVNGEGVVMYAAGAATTQMTPAAPTMTCPAVAGSGPSGTQQTITYQIVGFDALGGLTAASDISGSDGQFTTAPAVFGNPAVNISSIAQVSGTVTVNFSAPLGNTVAAGMTLHITGFGAVPGDKIFNGVWNIASAPSTSQVTFSLTGNYGSGTVSAGITKGRVSNVALISAISRSASGVVTVTTVENHNFTTQTGNNPTVVIIENVTPLSFFGYWVIASVPTANTFTIVTANYTAETGVVGANSSTASASTATCYEFITLACPLVQNNSPTIGYFIYSDSPSPGNGLKLIGKTLGLESHFTDWGPSLMAGFAAPGYVPTTPPVAAQNQLFSTHIVSGAGSTTLTVAAAPPTSIPTLGGTIVHDDSWAWKAATAARTQGSILLSPPANGNSGSFYVCNYPQSYPGAQDHILACGLVINETQTFGSTCGFSSQYGSTTTINPAFSNRNYSEVIGIGSPAIYTGTGFLLNGMGFETTANGINAVMVNGDYPTISNCSFDVVTFGTSVPLIFNGNGSGGQMIDCNYVGQSLWGDVSAVGQSCLTPLIPMVWLRASDNTLVGQGTTPAAFYLRGNHTLNGRGILVDQKYRLTGSFTGYTFGESLWNQAATNPTVAFWGQLGNDVTLDGILNDSSFCPVLFCGNTQGLTNVNVLNSSTAGTPPSVTGNPIVQLYMQGNTGQYQNVNSIIQTENASMNLGTGGGAVPGSITHQNQPIRLGASATISIPVAVQTPSASASGSGSFTGTYTVSLAYVGFDGAVTAQGLTTSVTASAQQIVVTWTLPAGFAGVIVGINNAAQNLASAPFTGTSHTFSSFGNQGSMPGDDATGLPCFSPKSNGTLVTSNLLIAGASIYDIAMAAPTLTASRAVTLADGAQSTALAASLTTTLNGSPYTVSIPGATSSSHVSITPTNASAATDFATGSVYAGTKSAGSIVINTGATAGETFDILVTPN